MHLKGPKRVQIVILEILQDFDNAYRKKTRDKYSLFDITQLSHLHEWDYSEQKTKETG